jgi:hypothetical protein
MVVLLNMMSSSQLLPIKWITHERRKARPETPIVLDKWAMLRQASRDNAAVRTLTEILEHPVKSLMCGSVERQDQLAPSDMLPVKAQFDNTRQD